MKRLLAASCLIFFLSTGAFAQTGTISGSVSDVSGAVIPGVEVTVLHVGTNLSRTVLTNERGGYVVPVLPIGDYNVTAVLPGFQTIVRAGIQLRDGNRTTVNMRISDSSRVRHLLQHEPVSPYGHYVNPTRGRRPSRGWAR